jgi:hypothetical protein
MAMTVGAGTGLLALAAAPLIHGLPSGRRAIGLVLATQAALLIRIGIAGPGTELEEIARAALLVVSAATGAALARAAAAARIAEDRDGTGGGRSERLERLERPDRSDRADREARERRRLANV